MSNRKGYRVKNLVLFFIILLIIISIFVIFVFKTRDKKEEKIYLPDVPIYTTKEKKLKINLYFSNYDDELLIPEVREIYKTKDVINQAKQAIVELIKGSYEGLMPTVSKGTHLRELYIDRNGCAYVDFTEEISLNHPGGSWTEFITIYSIVNTLTINFPEIVKVQILIEGESAQTLTGHIDISKPLTKNKQIIKIASG